MDGELVRLRRENRWLRGMVEIQRRLGGERDTDRLVPAILTEVSRLLDADRSSLFLVDYDRMELTARFAEGVATGQIAIPLRMGIVGAAAITRRLLNVADAVNHPYFNPDIDQVTGFQTESVLVMPLVQGDSVSGVLQFLNKRTGRFTAADEEEVAAVALDLLAGEPADAPWLQALCARLDCERGSLFRVEEEGGQLATVCAVGLDGRQIRLNLRLGVAGLATVAGKSLNIRNAGADHRFDSSADRVTGYTTRTLLCVPLVDRDGEAFGALQAINKKNGVFTGEDLEVLTGVAHSVAMLVENAVLFAEHERQFRSALEVMGASVDAKDPLTAGHSHKVAEYSEGIARVLGLDAGQIDVLRVAALLHDYGKIGVDDAVLKKAGALSPEEFAHMKRHAAMTQDILARLRFARKYRKVPLIAASHHECLDGSGYPRGLAAPEIPFMAKIIAVADVYEALTADRHYRDAMTRAQALALLQRSAGSKWDPIVIAALGRYLAQADAAASTAEQKL